MHRVILAPLILLSAVLVAALPQPTWHNHQALLIIARDTGVWTSELGRDSASSGIEKRESVWNKIGHWFKHNFAAPGLQDGYGRVH